MQYKWNWMMKASLLAILTLHGAGAIAAKTLVFCSEGSPEGFDPQLYTSAISFQASSVPVFNRLVEFETGSTKIVPALAESWKTSEDGLTYTFNLRRGVKFQSNARFKPSRDFNADDVLFSFNRMGDPHHPFHQLPSGQSFAYYLDMGMDKIIDKVEKRDDYTVVFTLKHPEAPFIANLGMDFTSIMSAEYAEKMKTLGLQDVINREPVGTGPFQFVSYQKDAVIRYKAFDGYWGGRPKIDYLIFAITPDASVRYAKLNANECQVMTLPKPADIPLIKANPAFTLLSKEGLNVGYVAFNVDKKPFDNKLVRQALRMATDKQAILKIVFQGAGVLAKNPIPPTLWSYNDKVVDDAFDLVKAKALLTKAGYPNGADIDLWYLSATRPYNPNGKRMAELMQADWAKIGIRARLVTYDWAEYIKRSNQGEQQVMMYGWNGDNGDPDNFFATLLGCDAIPGGGNKARWCNPAFETLIQQAKRTPRQAERAALYEKAQVIVHEEAPWITIAHAVRYAAIRKNVIGFKMSVFSEYEFQHVDLAQ
ncbi:ABC transporter substrate-binding protein [Glaciimonas immobilis]|uniref:Dipeptide transport system substrate-binding protein n=1 Tax=Glaciimonas immobilis TaxID=728004 RepID=A0A840RMS4_9BURK|nr:ABC transporter substrate-binding protein [Glaciimonas immobilis]KAF3999461.1 ABC transporter substrate-binding protein [Glaciimonas immobilis]MBB5198975.1 dipeptide transport system substrate-binding protein [Glaciimonas immobilis]